MALPLRYTLQGLRVRRVSTLLTMGGIALVVVVFVLVVGLAQGLRHAFTVSGSDDNVLFVRGGASSAEISRLREHTLENLRYLPQIARDARGRPLICAEAIEGFYVRRGDERLPVGVRGIEPEVFQIRRRIEVVAGRPPARWSNEALVGVGLARALGLRLGDRLRLGPTEWQVSGLFRADGGVYESEAWVDRLSLMRDRNRTDFNFVQARLAVAGVEPARRLAKQWSADPALAVRALVESDYYARQQGSSDTLRAVAAILALVMGLAMVITGMNTFYGLIAARTRELGTLRVLGFSRGDVVLSVLIEAAVLGLSGGVAGAVRARLRCGAPVIFQELQISFRIGPGLLLRGALLAGLVGTLGGLLPALRVSRLEVIQALRNL